MGHIPIFRLSWKRWRKAEAVRATLPQVAVMGLVHSTWNRTIRYGHETTTRGRVPKMDPRVPQVFALRSNAAAALAWVALEYHEFDGGRPCPLWIEDPARPARRQV